MLFYFKVHLRIFHFGTMSKPLCLTPLTKVKCEQMKVQISVLVYLIPFLKIQQIDMLWNYSIQMVRQKSLSTTNLISVFETYLKLLYVLYKEIGTVYVVFKFKKCFNTRLSLSDDRADS